MADVSSAAEAAPVGALGSASTDRPRTVPGRPSILGVGVVVWLSSELMFFAGLFGAYFTLRSASDAWPPADVHLAVGRTAAATAVLLGSSATMLTAVLGLVFLANQVAEYAELEFSISSHAYGSAFYLLTGFHGLHVAGGIAFMVATIGLVAGKSAAPPGPPVTVCGYYWHFVDVVWVAMFATLYLIQ